VDAVENAVGDDRMGNDTVRGLLRQYANYLTPEEAAEALGVTVGTIYRKLQAGDLAGFQLGRQWRIPPEELRKLYQREHPTS
jgi:excisionase family DNA binding protein